MIIYRYAECCPTRSQIWLKSWFWLWAVILATLLARARSYSEFWEFLYCFERILELDLIRGLQKKIFCFLCSKSTSEISDQKSQKNGFCWIYQLIPNFCVVSMNISRLNGLSKLPLAWRSPPNYRFWFLAVSNLKMGKSVQVADLEYYFWTVKCIFASLLTQETVGLARAAYETLLYFSNNQMDHYLLDLWFKNDRLNLLFSLATNSFEQ